MQEQTEIKPKRTTKKSTKTVKTIEIGKEPKTTTNKTAPKKTTKTSKKEEK